MTKIEELLQGILDRHTSRKNYMSVHAGPIPKDRECVCEDCGSVRRVMKILDVHKIAQNTPGGGF